MSASSMPSSTELLGVSPVLLSVLSGDDLLVFSHSSHFTYFVFRSAVVVVSQAVNDNNDDPRSLSAVDSFFPLCTCKTPLLPTEVKAAAD